MSKEPHWLLEFASNTFSQCGEDGVVEKILSLLPETDSWCVEFGAWDGIYLSNVRKLVLEKSYHAVLIEGDATKAVALKNNYADNDRVYPVNAFVGFEPSTGLDTILSAYNIPTTFDFLSIDIDGNDYYTWQAVTAYRPKVVCIEFNPTIPTEVNFVQARDPQISQGCSLLALNELGKEKGYQLVSVLPWNAIFVDQQYFPAFEISDNRPQTLRKDLSNVTWMFTGYDGSVHLAGSKQMLWHGISIDENQIQTLPKILRSYPANYSRLQAKLFRLLKNIGWLRA